MPNHYVQDRLAGIQGILVSAKQAGGPLSAASKGAERDYFLSEFLSKVFPNPFRFGHGDITDAEGHRTGQLDIVVEYPFLPSLPLPGEHSSRLYLAEGVGAVIEVKSDLTAQWDEVIATAHQLATVSRSFGRGPMMTIGRKPSSQIPFFAVGYSGWKQLETLAQHVNDAKIDGLLVIDAGLFVCKFQGQIASATGPWALWALVSAIHTAVSSLKMTGFHPVIYGASDATTAP